MNGRGEIRVVEVFEVSRHVMETYGANLSRCGTMVCLSVPAVSGDGDDTRAATLQELVEGLCVQAASFATRGGDGET